MPSSSAILVSDFTNYSILFQKGLCQLLGQCARADLNILLDNLMKNLLYFTPTHEFAFVDLFPYLFYVLNVHNYLFWMSNQIHLVLPPFLVSLILLFHLRLNFFTRQPSLEWSRSLFVKSRKAQTRDVSVPNATILPEE